MKYVYILLILCTTSIRSQVGEVNTTNELPKKEESVLKIEAERESGTGRSKLKTTKRTETNVPLISTSNIIELSQSSSKMVNYNSFLDSFDFTLPSKRLASKLLDPLPHAVESYYSAKDTEDYLYVKDIKCNEKICTAPSRCITKSICKCGEGLAHFKRSTELNNKICSYVQKKQLTAFLLEFFVGAGSGHFYTGRLVNGIAKFICFIIPFTIIIYTLFIKKKNDLENDAKLSDGHTGWILCLFYLIYVSWQVFDVVNFGVNFFKDGNGVPLEHW